jgi:nicotinate-nucleotide pyrophosphorylase (carboxylating)
MKDHFYIKKIIDLALEEDIGFGDITTSLVIDPKTKAKAEVTANEEIVIAGLEVFKAVFHRLDPEILIKFLKKEGDKVNSGTKLALLKGNAASILTGERVALNFLQRLSGIATLTRKFVETLRVKDIIILDTRKNMPGLRVLEKHAVRCGGAKNHRFNLSQAILIKDNHIAISGSIAKVVGQAKEEAPPGVKIEVEVGSLSELKQAISAGADIVLLDNMDPSQIKKAIEIAKGRVLIEISGGVTLENLPQFAQDGVNFISIGALTKDARMVDISLEMTRVNE